MRFYRNPSKKLFFSLKIPSVDITKFTRNDGIGHIFTFTEKILNGSFFFWAVEVKNNAFSRIF